MIERTISTIADFKEYTSEVKTERETYGGLFGHITANGDDTEIKKCVRE